MMQRLAKIGAILLLVLVAMLAGQGTGQTAGDSLTPNNPLNKGNSNWFISGSYRNPADTWTKVCIGIGNKYLADPPVHHAGNCYITGTSGTVSYTGHYIFTSGECAIRTEMYAYKGSQIVLSRAGSWVNIGTGC